jgi:hypothetical protein
MTRGTQGAKGGEHYRRDILDQWFSNFVRRLPGKFFLYKPRATYRAAARRLRNTGIDKRRTSVAAQARQAIAWRRMILQVLHFLIGFEVLTPVVMKSSIFWG